MPEMLTEKIYQDGAWSDKPAMVLPNGTKFVLLGYSRELTAEFRYSDQKFTFDFGAKRWDDDLNPTGSYKVFLGFGLRSMSIDQQAKVTADDLQGIASNIRDALLAWPPAKREAPVPINEIAFLMTPWREWQSQKDAYLELLEARHEH